MLSTQHTYQSPSFIPLLHSYHHITTKPTMIATTSKPNMLQTNPEITQSSLSILSKHHHSVTNAYENPNVINNQTTYKPEKMEPCQSMIITNQHTQPLLEPKLQSSDIHSITNCYELFRFSLNGNQASSKQNRSSSSTTTLTTCYSSSTYQQPPQQQHSIPNDLINLATMTPETFSHHSKLPSRILQQDMQSPIRTTHHHHHHYMPKFDQSPHLNTYQVESNASPSLISRSKIIGVVSRSSHEVYHQQNSRKSPTFVSETSSVGCKSPTRDDIPRAALSKIQKLKHNHAGMNKKKSTTNQANTNTTTTSSSSSTDEEEGKKYNTGTWTRAEHEQFLKGLEEVGKNWKLISENYVQTRKRTQIASHAQKWFLKLAEMKKGGDSLSNSEELYL